MAERLAAASGSFLATRAEPPQRAALVARFPRAEVNELGRTVYLPPEPEPAPTGRGTILVVTAGTSDFPGAGKAAACARAAAHRVGRGPAVGEAGLPSAVVRAQAMCSAPGSIRGPRPGGVAPSM